MNISFIIQENEIFAYKIIHIPVLSTYVQGKYSSYLVLLPHWHQYQVHMYWTVDTS